MKTIMNMFTQAFKDAMQSLKDDLPLIAIASLGVVFYFVLCEIFAAVL